MQALFFDSLAGPYFRSGDLDRAEEACKKIQSLDLAKLNTGDIYATSFYWLGRIAEKQGDTAGARGNFRKFLNLSKAAATL